MTVPLLPQRMVLGPINAKETDTYVALVAHYGFEPVFCNMASRNEKAW